MAPLLTKAGNGQLQSCAGTPRTTPGTSCSLVGACGSWFKWGLKWTANVLGLVLVSVPALTARLESWLSTRDDLFYFWGQVFALMPGLPGKYLRKCYYCLTLRACSLNCDIGFLSFFSKREAQVGQRVYIGAGATIGSVTLGDGTLVGSRVSILSGGHQHSFGEDGRLTSCSRASVQAVEIGEETWIGEGAVLMADVGSRCVVAAGSVVSRPVPPGCIVGGNPARFIGKVTDGDTAYSQAREPLR